MYSSILWYPDIQEQTIFNRFNLTLGTWILEYFALNGTDPGFGPRMLETHGSSRRHSIRNPLVARNAVTVE